METTGQCDSRDRQLWSDRELQVLIDVYPIEGARGVWRRLGGTRELDAIRQQASRLRVKAPYRWSKEDENELERLVESGVPIEEIALLLDRTVSAIEQKYRKLTFQREHAGRKRQKETALALHPVDSQDRSFLEETFLGARALLSQGEIKALVGKSTEQRTKQRYTVSRVREAMEEAGSIYVEGDVDSAASAVIGFCRCGEMVSKRAENWIRTPAGCENCRPTSCILARAEDRLAIALELAEDWGGSICHQAEPQTKVDKVAWTCSVGHVWEATISSVSSGTWCPHCQPLKSEQIVRSFLEQAFDAKFPKVRPDWLAGLELDGFNSDLNLGFEFQGRWHDAEEQARRDDLKRQRCAAQGTRLVEVWYQDAKLGAAGIRASLRRELERLGIAPLQDLAKIKPVVVPYGVQASHKEAFERQLADWGWTYDPSCWVSVDEKVTVDPKDGGGPIVVLPRTVIKGMLPGRRASNAVLTDAERQARLARSGWIWDKREPYVNAHQKLRLISPHGRVHLLTWNKWVTRHEGKTSDIPLRQLELDGLDES